MAMSAHSTIDIGRDEAREFIAEHLNTLTEADLARVMNVFLDEHLYNCRIVPDHVENDNDKLNSLLP
jgi:hypothetical protein